MIWNAGIAIAAYTAAVVELVRGEVWHAGVLAALGGMQLAFLRLTLLEAQHTD